MIKGLFRWASKYSRNEKILRQFDPLVRQINALEDDFILLSDAQLRSKTNEFKEKIAHGSSLEDVLVEAFATVREASKRVLGLRPFDVQLKGGIALHRGMIAEMKTGEGKTLVAALPVYLNALTGKGVHLVTVNDYLAQLHSVHMGHIYRFLGLSVGCIIQDLTNEQRRQAYHADITYGTNNEFGFDYLRDNMKFDPKEMCQRPFAYAIVDEVDSILIDEARTPLIISGPAEDSSDLYEKVDDIILALSEEDYEKEEKTKSVAFTDRGYEKVEELVAKAGIITGDDLFQPINLMVVHHLNQALKAQKMFHRDVDYIIKDGKVIIIDEFTGRMMKGRRYSDGLHQALEAKERVEVEVENQTLASITFQNYFRMYPKLAGMTGTAETEAEELEEIYKLRVLVIPTNVPVARQDLDDEIFRTFDQKEKAIVQQIKECHTKGQPVLVGTVSIERSEIYAKALQREGLSFNVLNARNHALEATIIAEAGVPGAITIATNMAGRGTDIKLGGNVDVKLVHALEGIENPEERKRIEAEVRAHVAVQAKIVKDAGGLFVVGTERHESRRIDNQLRGRSGRQGDAGKSKFFISLEDDLMRIFGPNLKLMQYSLRKNEEKDNDPIMHPWLSRSIEKAQQRVEAQHFDTRKHLLKYAEVLDAQRKAIYSERHQLIHMTSLSLRMREVMVQTVDDLFSVCDTENPLEQKEKLLESVHRVFGITLPVDQWEQEKKSVVEMKQELLNLLEQKHKTLQESLGQEKMDLIAKTALLRTLDHVWIAHLNAMEHLRSGIYLQAYGQKDPLNEYKHQAFIFFKAMITQWTQSALSALFAAESPSTELLSEEAREWQSLSYQHSSLTQEEEMNRDMGTLLQEFLQKMKEEDKQLISQSTLSAESSHSRNAPCFCGSGKRYKHCHGVLP